MEEFLAVLQLDLLDPDVLRHLTTHQTIVPVGMNAVDHDGVEEIPLQGSRE
jgi:hypothetical protein